MKEIIEYTNSEDFKFLGNLEMQKLRYDAVNSIAEIYIQTELNGIIKKWKIIARNPIKIGSFESYNFLNCREITISNNHPLLNAICNNSCSCKLVGKPENKFSFIGELCYEIEKITGNWITINEVITTFKHFFEKEDSPISFDEVSENNDFETLLFPKFLTESIKKVCDNHSVLINDIEEINNVFNYENKILIFGNEIVAGKNETFIYQPHIIAEEFELE